LWPPPRQLPQQPRWFLMLPPLLQRSRMAWLQLMRLPQSLPVSPRRPRRSLWQGGLRMARRRLKRLLRLPLASRLLQRSRTAWLQLMRLPQSLPVSPRRPRRSQWQGGLRTVWRRLKRLPRLPLALVPLLQWSLWRRESRMVWRRLKWLPQLRLASSLLLRRSRMA